MIVDRKAIDMVWPINKVENLFLFSFDRLITIIEIIIEIEEVLGP